MLETAAEMFSSCWHSLLLALSPLPHTPPASFLLLPRWHRPRRRLPLNAPVEPACVLKPHLMCVSVLSKHDKRMAKRSLPTDPTLLPAAGRCRAASGAAPRQARQAAGLKARAAAAPAALEPAGAEHRQGVLA